jgi:hypothetical protein
MSALPKRFDDVHPKTGWHDDAARCDCLLRPLSARSRAVRLPGGRMADVYFTADFHFGPANIIRYCDRQFANFIAMNEAISTD